MLAKIGACLPLRVAAVLMLASVSLTADELKPVPIPPQYDRLWLQELEPLLLEQEIEAYRTIDNARQRQAFRRGAIEARDPSPRLFLNQAKEALHHNVTASRRLGQPPDDPRSHLLVLHGAPSYLIQHGNCAAGGYEKPVSKPGKRPERPVLDSDCLLAHPFALFDYGPEAAVGWAPVLFATEVESHPATCRLFEPTMRPPVRILRFTPQACDTPWYDIGKRFNEAKKAHLDWATIRQTGLQVPPDAEWLASLESGEPKQLSTASRHPGSAASSPAMRYRIEEIVRATPEETGGKKKVEQTSAPPLFDALGELSIQVPASWFQSRLPWFNLSYRCDVFAAAPENRQAPDRAAALDRFGGLDGVRTVFRPQPGTDEVHIPLGLRLPAGSYVVVAHLEDEAAELFTTRAFELTISPDSAMAQSSGTAREGSATATSVLQQPTLRILPLEGLAIGLQTVEVETNGSFERIDYLLEDRVVATSHRPPFAAEVDFGPVPVERTLLAQALSTSGAPVSARLQLNVGLHAFDLRLYRQKTPDEKTVVLGEVTIPMDNRLLRVDLFEGEDLRATERDASFLYRPGTPAQADRPTLLRAVAHLDDGRSVERTLLLADTTSEQVDVQLVEVFVKANTRRGQAVLDLEANEIELFEDGRPQTLQSFERVSDLPIQLAVLLDTSSSMGNELDRLSTSSETFLSNIIEKDDKAALLTFNHRTYVAVPFTNDLELLKEGSRSLHAWGGTTLFESTVLALSYLKGLDGKRALVVISDGVSTSTEDILEPLARYAERIGVSVYTLGLGTGDEVLEAPIAKRRLNQLARLTGGEYFPIRDDKALTRAYGRIEQDLRTQYLLTFQNLDAGRPGEFRRIEVRTRRPGVELESRRGYYP